jgi:predicted ribosomally synthesized peptide with nif11-like leader
MSIADIERLATDLTINATLRAEAEKAFAASPATSVDDVIAFARAKGYSFTESELKEHAKAKAAGAGKQVTDAELDGVAGGTGGTDDANSIARAFEAMRPRPR